MIAAMSPEHADRLEQLRDRLDAADRGVGLASIRMRLADLLDDPAGAGPPGLAEALGRLALLAEVGECLADAEADVETEAGPVEEIRQFLGDALGRLADALRAGTVEEAGDGIARESAGRWGEYLGLVDPDWDAGASGGPVEALIEAPDPSDDAPAIDPAALLRLLTGAGGDHPTPHPGPPPQGGREEDSQWVSETAHVGCVEPSKTHQSGDSVRLRGLDAPDAGSGHPSRTPSQAKADGSGCPHQVDDRSAPGLSESHDPPRPSAPVALDPELRDVFLADAADLFERIEALVLDLGRGEDTGRLLELGRCYHTLKGAAGSVGLTDLSDAIHALEDRLESASGVAGTDLVRELEGSLRFIEANLAGLRPGQGGAVAGTTDESAPTPVESDGLIRVASHRIDALMDLASDLIARRRSWREQAERMRQAAEAARGCGNRLRASLARLEEVEPAVGPRSSALADAIRNLSEQAEDLDALAEAARAAAEPAAVEGEVLDRLSLQIWDVLQAIRVAPVRGLFQRLTRVAREAAQVEGRQVEVRLEGEEVTLDRTIQDRAFEPLLHVVRNAVGHGIEPPEARVRAGKPAAGRLTLGARREGNTVTLTVEDDGRGLDHPAIEAKGRRLGLIAPGETPDGARLNALIFQPGFSTRATANAISGRGVGMDVVAREIARLQGTIELDSRPGQGTRLSVRLPARLALAQVLMVRIDGQAFALPIESIEAVHPAEDAEVEGSTITLAGRGLPWIDARAVLGFSGAGAAPCPRLLVVRAGGEPLALRVDAIDGASELVIKPLDPLLAGHPTISGASRSTSGEIVLALSPDGLARLARSGISPVSMVGAPVIEDRPRVLVVDDSLSVRRVATRQLRALGFETEEVVDGEQAIRRLHERTFQLVLTDLEMPRMDGFELLAELGRRGALASTPVIVTSTRSDPATRRRVLELGARAFVAKPVAADDLARAVAPWRSPASDQGRDIEEFHG